MMVATICACSRTGCCRDARTSSTKRSINNNFKSYAGSSFFKERAAPAEDDNNGTENDGGLQNFQPQQEGSRRIIVN